MGEKDMPTNQLLPFANGDTPNVLPYAEWSALPARLTGFQSGIASSQQFNYILAQGGVAGYVLGQLVADFANQDATLNAEAMYENLKAAIAAFVPGNIADKSILAEKLADAIIETRTLANDSVTTEKILDNSISTAKIIAKAITTALLDTGAVTNEKISASTIAFDRLASSAIATIEQAKAGTANNVLMTPELVSAAIQALVAPALPSGAIMIWPGSTPPSGFLVGDGREVGRTTYAGIFSVYGTKFGAGDGSTTFNLPDLDGRFPEFTTDTSKVGNYVEAGLPNITGENGTNIGDSGTPSGAFRRDSRVTGNGGGDGNQYRMGFDASRSNDIFGSASVVQPASLLLLPCIKI